MMTFLAFYFGGFVAVFALQVLATDGRVVRPLFQACIWPVFITVTYAYELGMLDEDAEP